MAAAEPRSQARSTASAGRRLLPGLVLAVAIAVVARAAAGVLPRTVSEIAIAVLLGIGAAAVAGRFGGAGSAIRPGAGFATQRLLRLGIILLGARLGLEDVAAIGLPAIGIVVVTMAVALGLVLGLARLAAVEGRLALLLAVGAAVCGNSAVVATAPVIAARPREVAYAVATVTLFGTVAVFAYPLVGEALGLGDAAFGLWAGIAINDTSQVVAAGAAFSPEALEVATVVKLIRNALMAPLLLGIAWAWPRAIGVGHAAGGAGHDGPDAARDDAGPRRDVGTGMRRAVPLFVLGFLALTALRSAGLLGPDLVAAAGVASGWLILVALAAVGLSIRVADVRAIGPRSFAVGFGAAVLLGIGTVAAILGLGLEVGPGG